MPTEPERLLMVEDYQGTPVSVPESRLKVFLAAQEELKRKAAAGEPLHTPEEKAESDRRASEIWQRYRRQAKEKE